jgi:hypothetical protein
MTLRGTKIQLFLAQESKMRENHISAASLCARLRQCGVTEGDPSAALSNLSVSRDTASTCRTGFAPPVVLWFCSSSVQMAILTVVELVPQKG